MFRSGSVLVRKEKGIVRLEGVLPTDVADLLYAKGVVFHDGEWWVPEAVWPSVERSLIATGIAVGDTPIPSTREARFELSSVGEIVIYGAMPPVRDPSWLGRDTVKGYLGLSPHALPDAMQRFRAAGIEPKLSPQVQNLLQTLQERRRRALDVLEGRTPPIFVPLRTGQLRPYQAQAVAFADAVGGDMILGDDPGLGKTIVNIAIRRHFGARRVVVACPAVAKYNWDDEIQRFDDVPSVVLEGRTGREKFPDVGWVVTNYDLLNGRLDDLIAWDPLMIVLDESHMIKNPDTIRTKAAMRLLRHSSVRYRIPTTGTPVWNRTIDLWSQLNAVQDRAWGKQFHFGIAFAGGRKGRFGWTFDGSSREPTLFDWTRSVILRRLKKDVLADLPPKTRTVYRVDLPSSFRERYDAVYKAFRNALDARFSGEESRKAEADLLLAHLGELQRVSSVARVESTMDFIRGRLEEGKPFVVYSAFLEPLRGIRAALSQQAVKFGYIDGSVSAAERFSLAKGFQNGEFDVLVGQVEATGVAINLFRADMTVHHDMTRVPAQQLQAEDRVNRSGQVNPTTHVYMIGRNTVDERIMDAMIRKLAASTAILDTGRSVDADVISAFERDFFAGGNVS